MLKIEQQGAQLIVENRSYRLGLFLFAIEILTLYLATRKYLAGELNHSDAIGVALGLLVPLLGIYYFVEFATFRFDKTKGQFSWRWRNLLRVKSGALALSQIKRVRRDALSSSDVNGYHNTYRLIVITDEDEKIPLSRSFSGTEDKQLDNIVEQIKDFLGRRD